MAKQFLIAHKRQTEIHFRVWLDTMKTDKDGNPDPKWCRDYVFGSPPEGWLGATLNGVQYMDWDAYCQAEVELLANADPALHPAPAPIILAGQGKTF